MKTAAKHAITMNGYSNAYRKFLNIYSEEYGACLKEITSKKAKTCYQFRIRRDINEMFIICIRESSALECYPYPEGILESDKKELESYGL